MFARSGLKTIGVDINPNILEQLRGGVCPIEERGLLEVFKDSVTQGTLSHEMKFVLARGKIDGATVFGGDFPVYRHRKSGGDEWCCPWALHGPRFTPRG